MAPPKEPIKVEPPIIVTDPSSDNLAKMAKTPGRASLPKTSEGSR